MSRFSKVPNPGLGLTSRIGNLVLGVNADGSDFEWKELVGVTNVAGEPGNASNPGRVTFPSGGTPAWGSVTGDLDDQTDLKSVLDEIAGDISTIETAQTAASTHTGDYVLPEDFGAVGDGETSDSDAIRSAIATGKTIKFTKGKTYLTHKSLTLQEGQGIEGQGATLKRADQKTTTTTTSVTNGVTSQITVADASEFVVGDEIVLEQSSIYTTNYRVITAIDGNDITIAGTFPGTFTGTTNVYTSFGMLIAHANGFCRIRDLKFEGNRANWSFCRWEILEDVVIRGKHCIVENCQFLNTAGEVIVAFGSYNRITGCYAQDANGNGVHFSGGDHSVVDNCTFIGMNDDTDMGHQEGCVTWSALCGKSSVINCWMEDALTGCGGMGELDDSQVRILNNYIKGMSITGIHMYGMSSGDTASGNSVIANNFIEGGISALAITQSATPNSDAGFLAGFVISGNHCIAQTNSGIILNKVRDSTICNNFIDATSQTHDGISLATCFRLQVTNNHIYKGNRAIHVSTGVGDCNFIANTCYGQVSNAIYHTTTVIGNTAAFNIVQNLDENSANAYQGIICSRFMRVQNNRIILTNNGGALTAVRGIQIGGSATTNPGAICQFNYVTGNAQYGINTDGGTGKSIIQFNVVTPTTILRNGGGVHVGTVAVGTYTGAVTDGALASGAGNVTITNGGTGYSAGTGSIVCVFSQDGNITAYGIATLVNGSVTNVTITAGAPQGTGYSTPGTAITCFFGGNICNNNVILGVGANEDLLDPYPNLKVFNGLAGVADRLPYFNGTGTMTLQTFTATARSLMSIASMTNMRTVIGVPDSTDAITVTPGATPAILVTTGNVARWTAAEDEVLSTSGTHVNNRKLTLIITNDGTPRTITFGTGFAANTTALVGQASKTAILEFITNGTAYMEMSRKEGLG